MTVRARTLHASILPIRIGVKRGGEDSNLPAQLSALMRPSERFAFRPSLGWPSQQASTAAPLPPRRVTRKC